MMTPRSIPALCALSLSLLAGRAAHGENLVRAGQFDRPEEVDAWVVDRPGGVEASMNFEAARDAGSCAESGSAELRTKGSGTYTVYYEICAGAISPNEVYRVALSVYHPGGSGVGELYWGVAWFEGPDCTGAEAGASSVGPIGAAPMWQPVELGSSPAPGAVSAMVRLELDYRNAPDPLTLNVDRVVVRPIDELFDDGFEQGSECAWSAMQ